MKKLHVALITLVTCTSYSVLGQTNLICNGSFENPQISVAYQLDTIPCWKSSALFGYLEVWGNSTNPPAYDSLQFAEINVYNHDTIYQDFVVSSAGNLIIRFAHRGRYGTDTMGVQIGPPGGPYSSLGQFSDSTDAWGSYTLNYTLSAGGNYRIRFYSISVASGYPSMGNFLDKVEVLYSSTSSVHEKLNMSSNIVKIFPNPSNGKFTLCTEQGGVFELTDITGRVLNTYTIKNSTETIHTNLPTGIYFLREKGSVVMQKLIIIE